MHDVLDPWTNPVTYAVPFFLPFIGIELAALKWLDHDDNVTGYLAKDASTSVLMGLAHGNAWPESPQASKACEAVLRALAGSP